MTNVTKWIVEETRVSTGEQKTHEFTDYWDALDAFTAAEANPDLLVSLTKKTAKLLLED